MNENKKFKEIFSKKVRAGRRTYFFDVRSTKAGDYYMTINESIKETNENGIESFKKHKIYLYKEDFNNFKEALESVSNYIISEKGEKIISNKKKQEEEAIYKNKQKNSSNFTEVSFEDLGNQ